MMQMKTLPIWLYTSPELSLHSATVPLIEALDAVATAVELNKSLDPIVVILLNEKGPQGRVKTGGLWSIVSEQSMGRLNTHRVTPLASLS